MFGSLLLVLSALGAGPVETTTFATCVRPVAKLAAPKIEHVAGAARSTDCHQIALWLRRWEQAARHRPALSAARRDVLWHKVETDTNAHTAAALELMIGPLNITRLRESFAWTITDRDAGRIQLEAIPRDDTERLFYASIRVWLDENDGALNQLQVVSRSGETRFVWRNDAAPESLLIQLVSAAEEASSLIIGDELPSPSAPIPANTAPAEEPGFVNTRESSSNLLASNAAPRIQTTSILASLFVPEPSEIVEPDPTDLSPVAPDLEAILSQWEAASRKTTVANVAFKRTVTNTVFEIETLSEGRICYQTPHLLTAVLRGVKPALDETSDRKGKDGRPYRMKADRSETLVWTQNSFILANDDNKTYETVELLPDKRPHTKTPFSLLVGPFHQTLPFLFEIRSEQLRREWTLKLTKLTDGKAVIEATPRTAMLKRSYGRCFVSLDTKEWRIDSMKYVDPNANVESTFLIQEWRINPEGWAGWNWGPVFVDFPARGYTRFPQP